MAKDHGAACPCGDVGAGKDQVGQLGRGQRLAEQRLGALAHGVRFPAKGGLVDTQFRLLYQAPVGADGVPLGQQHEVARRQRVGRNAALDAVPQHVGINGQQLAQRLGRLFRLVFLPEVEEAVDEDHQPDGDAQLRHAGHKGQRPGGPAQDRHQVRKIGGELDPERRAPGLLDAVGSCLLQAVGRFSLRQPGRARGQRRKDLRRRQREDGRCWMGIKERIDGERCGHRRPLARLPVVARCGCVRPMVLL